MRRSPLRRVSAKRRRQRAADALLAATEGARFAQAIKGARCAVCGKTSREAQEGGSRHVAHHGVPRAVLRKRGLRSLLWAPENAICLCDEPCHRRHTDRVERIPRAALPPMVLSFAFQHGLVDALEREYPS